MSRVLSEPQPLIVVEDDEGLNRLVCLRLEQHGWKTIAAQTGAEALAAVRSCPGCLLLLDYVLPDMTARQVVELLAQERHSPPFIVMTGHGDERVAVEMMKLGARDYIVKDVNFTELLPAVVGRVLRETETESRLAETETRFRGTFEQAAVGIAHVAPDGRYRLVNRRLCDITGYSEEELLARTWQSITHPHDLAADTENVRRLLADEIPSYVMEKRYIRKDGSPICINLNVALMRREDGAPDYFISVVEDISERKRADLALRESEERLRLKLDSVLDPDTHIEDQELANILDVPALQSLMDRVYEATGIAVGIRDLDGNELVRTGWQGICTRFHRANPQTLSGCDESDRRFAQGLAPGEFRVYQCSNGLRDAVTPIFVGGRQVGNVYFGQFFFEDEAPDRELFSARAEEYGFDKEAYLAALDRVPRWSRERLASLARFHADLSMLVSRLSYGNLKLALTLIDRRRAEEEIRAQKDLAQRYLDVARVTLLALDSSGRVVMLNRHGCELLGVASEAEALGRDWFAEFLPPGVRSEVRAQFDRLMAGEADPAESFENPVLTRQGEERLVEWRSSVLRDRDGRSTGTLSSGEDVTEQRRAGRALAASRKLLATAERLTRAGGWYWDIRLQMMTWTDEAYRIHGLEPGAIAAGSSAHIERSIECYHPDDRPVILAAFRRCAEEGAAYDLEFPFTAFDGRRLVIRTMAEPVREDGRVVAVVGSIMDVSEQKRVEQALRESEKRYRDLADLLPEPVFEAHTDGQLLFANRAAFAAFGYSEEEFGQGVTVADLLVPENRDRARANFERVVRGEPVGPVEYTALRRDGSRFPVIVRAAQVRQGRRVIGLRGTVSDITELKRAEELERGVVREQRFLAEATLDFVRRAPGEDIHWILCDKVAALAGDACVVVSSYNSGTDRFTVRAASGVGCGMEMASEPAGRELVGLEFRLTVKQLAAIAGERLRPVDRGLRGLFSGGSAGAAADALEREFDAGGAYSAAFFLDEQVFGLVFIIMRGRARLHSPELIGSLLSQTAIVLQRQLAYAELELYRKHLEQIVEQRTEDLREAQARVVLQEKLATVGRVAGSVAHELRNPLGAIKNASYFLQKTLAGRLVGKELRHLGIIDTYVDRANDVITAILDFTQQRAPERRRCALRPILERAVADAALPRGAEVLFELGAEPPFVRVDARQIAVVFRNLIANAGQAMAGHGCIRVVARRSGPQVAVDVIDNGVGIAPELMSRLFEPLFSTREIGVGLGLAIARAFAEANGGTIGVRSQVGEGTTFTVLLPVAAD